MVNWAMFKDYFGISLRSIAKRRMRSWLTMVGIFIGIAAVVALMSLGQGLQDAVFAEFAGLGAETIFVTPGGAIFGSGGADSLTEDDIDVLKSVRGIDQASGYFFSTGKIEWDDEVRYYVVHGLVPSAEFFDLFAQINTEIIKGREFRSGDKFKAIIGYDYTYHPTFSKHLDVGDKVTINGYDFDIIGVWDEIGNSVDDRSISLPIDTAREVLNVEERLDGLFADIKDGEDPVIVAERVEDAFRRDRKLKEGEEDFSVQTFQDFLETFTTILTIITTVLAGIAAISLVVGGIGIMNTMYTAVLERTQEIGIMKAIGARNSDVLLLFLIESGLLGMAGGLIGIVLGAGIALLTAYLAQTAGGFDLLQASFPLWLIFGALAFSFVVGVLSGILPARQAAMKNPVDSLRYE